MRKYLLLILMLHFVSVIHAQITISMHIDYIQNNDTILKDTIVPYLRINFQNNTDTAQYFVLNNYEKYPNFSAGAMLCYTTPEEFFAHKNKFEYMKCDDKHYVYIHNNSMDILHIDLRKIGEEEFPEEISNYYRCKRFIGQMNLLFKP